MHGNWMPLIVSLIIWGAIFLYLWRLDSRIQDLQQELDDRTAEQEREEEL